MGTPLPSGGGLGVRHVQATILFIGLAIAFALRVNFSVGIVAMTDNTTNPGIQTVNWTSVQQGTILGSFFWGYVMTQVPSGLIAARFGPKIPLGITMIINGLTTLLLPMAAIYGGFLTACFARVIQGMGQGFVYPSYNTLMSKWCVPQERSRIYAFIFGGSQFGSVIMMIGAGFLAASSGGWPSIYYVSGGLAIAWGIICLLFISDSPDTHKSISIEERIFIETSLISTSKELHTLSIPWKSIFTSVPFWSLLICHVATNWGFWSLLTLIPTYLRSALHFDIEKNGFLSALPYIAMWISSLLFSVLSDYLVKKKIFSYGTSRKFWNSLALYGGAVALALLALLNTDSTGAVILLTVAVGLNSGTYSGYYLNHLDLSPNFAGTLMGITNSAANIGSIFAPTLAGVIVEGDVSQWSTVFLITAGIHIIGQTVFNIFGSGEVQDWNEGRKKPTQHENPEPVHKISISASVK